jgi:hypothetical protein
MRSCLIAVISMLAASADATKRADRNGRPSNLHIFQRSTLQTVVEGTFRSTPQRAALVTK